MDLGGVLDSCTVLQQALQFTKRSKYAFARAAGLSPNLLSRYLDPNGSQMSARKLEETLLANGIMFRLEINFDSDLNAGLRTRHSRGTVASAANDSEQAAPLVAPAPSSTRKNLSLVPELTL